ncbi:TonB-dependent receptor [Sphingomonas kaistensis]|uniref:TonB-dependent receptor n=1 Tax=Sphingomonas kaistensis TaxID=298708 RepID=A0ABZ2G4Q3_9SPHN
MSNSFGDRDGAWSRRSDPALWHKARRTGARTATLVRGLQRRHAVLACSLCLGTNLPALAQQPTADEGNSGSTIIVTAPGGTRSDDAQLSLDEDRLGEAARPDLLSAISRSVAAVGLQDAQGNPFQPNLSYRGFVASPLQGQAQGLAVYLDGARFNQPFGDTVQFDLLPEVAIQKLEIFESNPLYGLNALGGAIVLQTKTGRTSPGIAVTAAGGAFGEREVAGEAGWRGRRASIYAAVQQTRDRGWRYFSPSRLRSSFADLGWDGERAGLHLKLVGADNDLTGNGSVPVELYALDRRAVFTHPDITLNRFVRGSVHPWLMLGNSGDRLEGVMYLQRLRQDTLNGDHADIEVCEAATDLLCLEGRSDGEEPLFDELGKAIGASSSEGGYGLVNRSKSRGQAGGILVQFVRERETSAGKGRLVVGFSHDASRTQFNSSSELGMLTDDRGVEGLGPIVSQLDGSITPVSLSARTSYGGLFLAHTIPLKPMLAAELDARWNRQLVRLDDQLGTALDGRHLFKRLNLAARLKWQPASGIVLRAGLATNSRAPTPAELACADEEAPCSLTNFFVGDPPLNQVVTHTYSADANGRTGRLNWQIAAYRSVNRDDIQFVSSAVRGRAYFRNVGSTRRQGAEAHAIYENGPFRAAVGYAFTDATFRTPTILNSPLNPGADDSGRINVEPGDQIPGVPRHRFTVQAKLQRRAWSIGADVSFSSGQHFFGDENNADARTPRYSVLNLRGSATVTRQLRLFGEVRNALDVPFATFGTYTEVDDIYLKEAPNATNPRSIGPGTPRRVTVGMSAEF